MKARTAIIILLGFLFSVFSLTADAVIKEFRVEPGINQVYIIWKISLESNVLGYKIQRGFDPGQLLDIGFVEATNESVPEGGVKEYNYSDNSVFKGEGRSFYYRIVVLNPNKEEVTQSSILQVSPQISGIRHTWGSIKAIFR